MSCTVESDLIYANNRVRLRGTFRDEADALIDPDAVTFRVQDPNGDVTEYVWGTDVELEHPSEGIFEVEQSVPIAGTWTFIYESTGAGQAAGQMEFEVTALAF